ncbi:MAG: hypothetical protein JNK48_21565 [Bryobacterales bacterium]|nr:hypothetical protein [Bryobacterales bacterium]
MSRTILVLVGGFLGAGKTSLILAAAHMLEQRGIRAAVILNDQAGSLVDTELARRRDVSVDQVTGGCFCCRFHDLAAAAERLLDANPAVIFAEPVGSCTDIAATVVQPLVRLYGGRLHVAPFTVLVDPSSAVQHECDDLAYLYGKQIEEADLVRTTKADLHPEAQISARTGQGIVEWLQEVLAGTTTGGSRLIQVDYGCYARAEAVLGWLNFEGMLRSKPAAPAEVVGPLLDKIVALSCAAGVVLVHCKAIGSAATGYVKAAVTANSLEPDVEGDLTASPSTRHRVLLNLRGLGDPDSLRRIVDEALDSLPGEWLERRMDSFRPAAPVPAYRPG